MLRISKKRDLKSSTLSTKCTKEENGASDKVVESAKSTFDGVNKSKSNLCSLEETTFQRCLGVIITNKLILMRT